MRLVDAEVVHGDEDVPDVARPPRPEKRRVHTSLAVTFAVLVGTVATVYGLFPERHNQLLTATTAAHRDPGAFELETPTAEELAAWSLGVLGERPPFPGGGMDILGARRMTVLERPAVLVRYAIGGDEVTLALLRARDAPPRRHLREHGDELARSWRSGSWTVVAVGPAASADRWLAAVGAR